MFKEKEKGKIKNVEAKLMLTKKKWLSFKQMDAIIKVRFDGNHL